ncbi:hypothetical protein QVD17_28330 [Tagetes erecta]|uniref:Photosystem I assembly protein Ycf4 n=1 Tax=Tagetes erecta TaxID=13708 RepID=A0AAD8KGI9_TARER|nr:hypothetical protein QVD17_28330 [Tagetes erecta]
MKTGVEIERIRNEDGDDDFVIKEKVKLTERKDAKISGESIFRWGFLGKIRRVFLRFLIKDIQSVRIEVKEGIYARRVLYMDIRGQGGAIPLTRTYENFTPWEMEQKAVELAYFLGVPIEVF